MSQFSIFEVPYIPLMPQKKNIFVIIGSASKNSANLRLMQYIQEQTKDIFNMYLFEDLKLLPHFDAELSVDNTPLSIIAVKEKIAQADGIIMCSPEYVFSIPSGLKNLIEWCVSSTVFSEKPTGIITASASGVKGHNELQLIMKTVMASFTQDTCLLIQGIKGKINQEGEITERQTIENIAKFIDAFKVLLN